jgi:hypothetical protein
MTWLRPIGASDGDGTSASLPTLDDGAQGALLAEEQLQKALVMREATRSTEHEQALSAVSSSERFLPSTGMLSREQLGMLQPKPSAHLSSGVLGRKSRPSKDHLHVLRSPGGLQQQQQQQHRSWAQSQTFLLKSESLARSLPSLDSRSQSASPQQQQQERQRQRQQPMPSDKAREEGPLRPRSLVHLDRLPPTLDTPHLRPSGSCLGACVGPIGLGARGDVDLSGEEADLLRTKQKMEQERRVVAPLVSLSRGATAPWLGGTGGLDSPPASPETAAEAAAQWKDQLRSARPRPASSPRHLSNHRTRGSGLLQSSSNGMLRLPTQLDMRRASSLAGLVPPEPTESILRARAADRRALHNATSSIATLRLSQPPLRFSSAASRAASPLDFLASITDWSRAGTPHAAREVLGTEPTARLRLSRGSHGVGGHSPEWPPPPPSATLPQQAKRSLPAGRLPAGRRLGVGDATASTEREWVKLQASLDADATAFAAKVAQAARAGLGPPTPLTESAPSVVGNFIEAQPVAKRPARSLETHGVPWMRSQARGRRK